MNALELSAKTSRQSAYPHVDRSVNGRPLKPPLMHAAIPGESSTIPIESAASLQLAGILASPKLPSSQQAAAADLAGIGLSITDTAPLPIVPAGPKLDMISGEESVTLDVNMY